MKLALPARSPSFELSPERERLSWAKETSQPKNQEPRTKDQPPALGCHSQRKRRHLTDTCCLSTASSFTPLLSNHDKQKQHTNNTHMYFYLPVFASFFVSSPAALSTFCPLPLSISQSLSKLRVLFDPCLLSSPPSCSLCSVRPLFSVCGVLLFRFVGRLGFRFSGLSLSP